MQKGVAVFKKYIKYAMKTSYSLAAGVRELKGLCDIQIHDFKTITDLRLTRQVLHRFAVRYRRDFRKYSSPHPCLQYPSLYVFY